MLVVFLIFQNEKRLTNLRLKSPFFLCLCIVFKKLTPFMLIGYLTTLLKISKSVKYTDLLREIYNFIYLKKIIIKR